MKAKKLIAPIIITIIISLYLAGMIAGYVLLSISIWINLVAVLVGIVFIGIAIFVLVERIKEIRSGDEDDLSQY